MHFSFKLISIFVMLWTTVICVSGMFLHDNSLANLHHWWNNFPGQETIGVEGRQTKTHIPGHAFQNNAGLKVSTVCHDVACLSLAVKRAIHVGNIAAMCSRLPFVNG